jgi:hypothetical protein
MRQCKIIAKRTTELLGGKKLEEQRIWKEEMDNSLGKRNKTAFIYKTKEIKRLMNSKINGI